MSDPVPAPVESSPAPAAPGPARRLLGLWPAWTAFGLFPLLLAVSPRGFHGNDDTLMVETLRGGHPCPYLGEALSAFLVKLYAWAPGCPWYGLLLYATLLWALFEGLSILKRLDAGGGPGRRAALVVAGALWLFVVWGCCVQVTYTQASILGLGTALVSFAVDVRLERITWRRALACGLLGAAGILWRPMGLMAAGAALGLGAVLFLLVFLLRYRDRFGAAFLCLLLPLAGAVGANRAARAALPPAEAAYRQYDAVRGSLQGFDNYENLYITHPEALRATGWYSWEFPIFMSYLQFDEERYPLERIAKLQPLAQPLKPFGPWAVLKGNQAAMFALALALLPVLVLPLAGLDTRRRLGVWLLLLAQTLLFVAVLTFLGFAFRAAPRVALPMAGVFGLTAMATAWWCLGADWLRLDFRWKPVHAGVGLAATGAVAALAWQHRRHGLFTEFENGVPAAAWVPYFLCGLVAAGLLAAQGVLSAKSPGRASVLAGTWLRRGAVLAVALVLGLGVVEGWRQYQSLFPEMWRRRDGDFNACLARAVPQAEKRIFVEYTCISPFAEGVDPILTPDPVKPRTIFLAWSPPSPFFQDNLRAAGIGSGHQLMQAIYDRRGKPDEILLLVRESHLMILEICAQRSLGKLVHFEQAYPLDWSETRCLRMVDGPSPTLNIMGFPRGSAFQAPGRHVNGPAAIFEQ